MRINATLFVVGLALLAAGPVFAYPTWGWSFALSALGVGVLTVVAVRAVRGRSDAVSGARPRDLMG